jgi:hypothetical protein
MATGRHSWPQRPLILTTPVTFNGTTSNSLDLFQTMACLESIESPHCGKQDFDPYRNIGTTGYDV